MTARWQEVIMEQLNFEEEWEKVERHGAPCMVDMLCREKKTYTGPGEEYTPLWDISNENIPLQLEEIKRNKNGVLWGRLKSGKGWVDLKETKFHE